MREVFLGTRKSARREISRITANMTRTLGNGKVFKNYDVSLGKGKGFQKLLLGMRVRLVSGNGEINLSGEILKKSEDQFIT